LLRLQTTEIIRAPATVGVTPVWLKGAAELLDPGRERSGRMIQDIDLWIPCPQELGAAHALVQATVTAVPPLSAGRTPLMKSLDVARRLAADVAGETPDSLRPVLFSPQWGGTVAIPKAIRRLKGVMLAGRDMG
jgi:hypothetical protein